MDVQGTCFPPEPCASCAFPSSHHMGAASPPLPKGKSKAQGMPGPDAVKEACGMIGHGSGSQTSKRVPAGIDEQPDSSLPPALPPGSLRRHPGHQPCRQISLTLALVSGTSKQIKKGSVDGGQMGHCSPQWGRRMAERALGQPKLTGESSRLVLPQGDMPGQSWWQLAVWWSWSLEGQSHHCRHCLLGEGS